MKYESNPKDYEIVSLLGRCCGQIGIVLLAKHKQRTLVAVKKFDLEKADHKDVTQIQVLNNHDSNTLLHLESKITVIFIFFRRKYLLLAN